MYRIEWPTDELKQAAQAAHPKTRVWDWKNHDSRMWTEKTSLLKGMLPVRDFWHISPTAYVSSHSNLIRGRVLLSSVTGRTLLIDVLPRIFHLCLLCRLVPCRCFVSHKVLSSACSQQERSCTDALPVEKGICVFSDLSHSRTFSGAICISASDSFPNAQVAQHNEYVEGWWIGKINPWKAGGVFDCANFTYTIILGIFSVQHYFLTKTVSFLLSCAAVIVQFNDRKIEGDFFTSCKKRTATTREVTWRV